MFSRVAVIYNPASGRPRARQASVGRFTSLLREAGREAEAMPTERPGHATDLARTALERGFDLVVAHGGDGTVNEVMQPLVGTRTVLGFWPGGTANVLAREIGFPHRAGEVVDRILAGQTRRVTVGKANDRYFLLMAGIGLDAAVVGSVDPLLKKRLGKGAFALSALQLLWRWNLELLQVQAAGRELEGRFVVAGNGRHYGGGFVLTPGADLSDPELDLCVFSSASRADYAKYALASLFGTHRRMPGVTYLKARSARVTGGGADGAMVQLDGEVAGRLPLTLEAVPDALTLLV